MSRTPEKQRVYLRSIAIAEWPTAKVPCDYVLFAGLTPVAAVKAKRQNADVAGKIVQAQRYSRGFQAEAGHTSPTSPSG